MSAAQRPQPDQPGDLVVSLPGTHLDLPAVQLVEHLLPGAAPVTRGGGSGGKEAIPTTLKKSDLETPMNIRLST